MTSGCTQENWYSRRYCGQLTEIDNKISELDERINGYGLYVSAVKHRDAAMANLSGLNPASVEQAHHPVFNYACDNFGNNGAQRQSVVFIVDEFCIGGPSIATVLFKSVAVTIRKPRKKNRFIMA